MDYPTGFPSTPKKSRVNDRFIPRREGVNLEAAFSVASSARSPRKRKDSFSQDGSSNYDSRTFEDDSDMQDMYSTLLKSELFSDVPAATPLTPQELSPDRAAASGTPSSSNMTMSNSRSSLSLHTTPRKKRDYESKNMFKYSPKKLIRFDSDLSDMSLGGASGSTGGGGLGSSLRPESRDYLLQPKQKPRSIKGTPYKVLDAPCLQDDFYLNLTDWGPSNKLAVGLGRAVYLWDAVTGGVTEAMHLADHDMVTSVSWMSTGEHLAVGTETGQVQIWDVMTSQRLRQMSGHTDRTSSLSWNDHILSSGSRDCTILHRDVRIRSNYIHRLEAHHGEVCGLKWNTDLQQMASGSNDNQLMIWPGVNHSSPHEPLYQFDEHKSAVKALAWSPHQRGLLASGGGFCDQRICFWNTLNGSQVSSKHVGSQVCSLVWSTRTRELISAHGGPDNEIVVWKYQNMTPVTRLKGHLFRVLQLSLSPDGTSIATGAGDETLRLWTIYDNDPMSGSSSVLDMYSQLR